MPLGLGHPLHETLLDWSWDSEPAISVVFSMDPGRNRIKSSHFALHGAFYDSATRAEKVIPSGIDGKIIYEK